MPVNAITEVEVVPLRQAGGDGSDLDSSSETVVVLVHDEAGNVGVGEADAPAEAVRDLIVMDDAHAWSRGLRGMLLGRDPFEIGALHDELYVGTIYHGRRGLGIHALSAIDIALHDLVGKQLGRPAYQLLGGARRPAVTPYATVYIGEVAGRTLAGMMDDMVARCDQARALGFHAVKAELLFGELANDRQLVHCIRETRDALGDDIALMLDFGYRWDDWRAALAVLRKVEEYAIYFVEATLAHDDVAGHAKLADRVEMRVGGAEFAATVHECREWLELGRVDVLQPDVSRCGGLTEIARIAELAALYGALVIPHGWKTGITAAAQRHFQIATPNSPWIEMMHPALFPSSALRAALVRDEPVIADGAIALPTAPGLGIELDADVLAAHAIGPERAGRSAARS